MTRSMILTMLFAGLAAGITLETATAEAGRVRFERDVQPILKRHCDRCHGGMNREAGLALTTKSGLLGTADSEEAIVVPGDAATSLLWIRLTDHDAGDLMPLDGEPLSRRELNVIRSWINAGADAPDSAFRADDSAASHWAYQRPTKSIDESGADAIDMFVRSRLADTELAPSPAADEATLARRVALVLTGLPATPEQIERFTENPGPQRYEELVDELLASPRFGEHWARHWLDLARYADSNGFQADQLRDSWAYRDWVVDAFNGGKPFDDFAIEQLAGDLLPDATAADRIATGFHRTPTCNVEAGVQPEANRVNQVFDRVNTTATVFLGTTFECAQCHDHKYDPFSQVDYYRMFAYFNNTPMEVKQTAGVTYDFVGPKMDLPYERADEAELTRLEARMTELEERRQDLMSDQDFETWVASTRAALEHGKAEWITPVPLFSSTGGESFQILDDGSVLLDGTLPGSTLYRFDYRDIEQPVIGIRLDALTDDSLPGTGPGRGDPERTNFVLHEIQASVSRATAENSDAATDVVLADATASFSQAKYDVSQAIDGNAKTAWAVAPQFKKPHWAAFRTVDAVSVDPQSTFTVTLDQHYGRGRVIGRPKISLLVGNPATADLTDEIVDLLREDGPLTDKQAKALRDFHSALDPAIAKLDRQIASTEKALDRIERPTTLVMVEMDKPRETFVMERGDYLARGEQVAPGTPESLHPLDPELPKNRLGFAQWLVDPANPLMARVTVNRFWGEVFGRGIVATPEDFGTQCESPSHPALLDWLAVDFIEHGWSVKHLLKTIVMSDTFRQSSRVTPELLAADPDNTLLARGPRYRLPAEALRDNALAVAGLLSTAGDGEPIMPYQPDGIWRAVGRNQPKWVAASDEKRFRRGLYVIWKRGAPYPSFVTFDAPDRASCTVNRPRTNTPLQALTLLNDPAYAEAAVGLSQRMLLESPDAAPETIAATGYKLATGHEASRRAIDVLTRLAREESERLAESEDAVKARLQLLPASYRDASLDPVDVAAWFAVANALLNLDDVITVR